MSRNKRVVLGLVVALALAFFLVAVIFIRDGKWFPLIELNDRNLYTTGEFAELEGGEFAARFLPDIESVADLDYEFFYHNGLHALYPLLHGQKTLYFALDVRYDKEQYQAIRDELPRGSNTFVWGSEYDAFRVDDIEMDGKEGCCFICTNEKETTVRYLIFVDKPGKVLEPDMAFELVWP